MRDREQHFIQIKKEIDSISPSFCSAKWLQVTLHLHNGHTHSCHHPQTHKIPLEEIQKDPSALHNTKFKMLQRKMMLEGERPKECDYCWNIEDLDKGHRSDRYLKTSDTWSYKKINEVAKHQWDKPINPTYLEVSFSNLCNFKCIYCSPVISSAIYAEVKKNGQYPTASFNHDLEYQKKIGQASYSADEENPYVEAFWKWLPGLANDLEVLRVTGGEPLIQNETYKLLDFLNENPQPNLELAINTNFGVPDFYLQKFFKKMKSLIKEKKIGKFKVFTSVDTSFKRAEYIRDGLSYKLFWKNVDKYLAELNSKITFMITFNCLSAYGFTELLQRFLEMQEKHQCESNIDISYIRHPSFLGPAVLGKSIEEEIEKSITFMKNNLRDNYGKVGFYYTEHEKLERILDLVKDTKKPTQDLDTLRGELIKFVTAYDARRGFNFAETFPEFAHIYKKSQPHNIAKRLYQKVINKL